MIHKHNCVGPRCLVSITRGSFTNVRKAPYARSNPRVAPSKRVASSPVTYGRTRPTVPKFRETGCVMDFRSSITICNRSGPCTSMTNNCAHINFIRNVHITSAL